MGAAISQRRRNRSLSSHEIPELYGDVVMTATGELSASQMQALFLQSGNPDLAFIPQMPVPEMQETVTIQNDINLKKTTLAIIPHAEDADKYGIRFNFDSKKPCTIQLQYLATENEDEVQAKETSTITSFPAALNQEYDHEFLDISKYNVEENLMYKPDEPSTYPLIITLADQTSSHFQMTYATLSRDAVTEQLKIQVLKQKLGVDGEVYELKEIYGIDQAKPRRSESDQVAESKGQSIPEEPEHGSECIICMSEPNTTTLLPCRHMCLCDECAEALRQQSNVCPICRTTVDSLLKIKVSGNARSDEAKEGETTEVESDEEKEVEAKEAEIKEY